MLLLLAQPLVTLYATSSGFDFFSATPMFGFVLVTLYACLKQPTPHLLAFLWMQMVVFANIRYESVFCMALILPGLLWFRTVRRADIRAYRGVYGITPILFLPLFWQFTFRRDAYNDSSNAEKVLFHWNNIPENLQRFCEGHLHAGFFLPYAVLLLWLGLIALLLLARLGGNGGGICRPGVNGTRGWSRYPWRPTWASS